MALNNPIPRAPWGEYVPHVSHLTVDQFEALPDEDGWTFELHQGRLIRMPGPGDVHSVIHMRLSGMLWTTLPPPLLVGLRSTNCYYLSLSGGDEVLCPDLSYSIPERVSSIVQRSSYLAITPD